MLVAEGDRYMHVTKSVIIEYYDFDTRSCHLFVDRERCCPLKLVNDTLRYECNILSSFLINILWRILNERSYVSHMTFPNIYKIYNSVPQTCGKITH